MCLPGPGVVLILHRPFSNASQPGKGRLKSQGQPACNDSIYRICTVQDHRWWRLKTPRAAGPQLCTYLRTTRASTLCANVVRADPCSPQCPCALLFSPVSSTATAMQQSLNRPRSAAQVEKRSRGFVGIKVSWSEVSVMAHGPKTHYASEPS